MRELGESIKLINDIKVISNKELNEIVEKINTDTEVVEYFKFDIDKSNNALEFDSYEATGVIVNISSKSLSQAYNKFHTKGLFDLNIRRYIRNKRIDDGIKETLDKDRDNFWFYNNGLTIACDDYHVDGDNVKLYDFSIVNGGQTTTLIGTYTGNNQAEFYIPCKIIKKQDLENSKQFYNKIAEATNSQKPIQPRDLRSNSREMQHLQRILKNNNIDFQIKRGVKADKSLKYSIRNDDYSQIFYSFVKQKPGRARSNKRSLFDNNTQFSQIFSFNINETDKKDFVIDLIELNDRFETAKNKINKEPKKYFNDADELNVFKNAKISLFAFFGIVYSLVNEDITLENLTTESMKKFEVENFGSFISNYKNEDIDELLLELIQILVEILVDEYLDQYSKENVTSISNFFKTDSKYTDIIVPSLISKLKRGKNFEEIMRPAIIFKRKS